MDRSFMGLDKLSEYFYSTVVQLEGVGLAAIIDIGIDDMDSVDYEEVDEYDNDYSYMASVNYRDEKGNNKIKRFPLNHYDDCSEYIKPWLPPSFFATTDEHGDVFFCLSRNKPSSGYWKKSASNERYLSLADPYQKFADTHPVHINYVGTWKFVKRDLQEAVFNMLNDNQRWQALDHEFCVCSVENVIALRFLGSLIGKVNDDLTVTLHPKYRSHFASRVSKFARIKDE